MNKKIVSILLTLGLLTVTACGSNNAVVTPSNEQVEAAVDAPIVTQDDALTQDTYTEKSENISGEDEASSEETDNQDVSDLSDRVEITDEPTANSAQIPEEKKSDDALADAVDDSAEVAAAPKSRLSVKGTTLVDKEGKLVVLRGVSTHGLSWFPEFANADAYKTMRDDWGINCIRLAMYTAEYNGYCTGDENNKKNLKKLILSSVKSCKELGLYVIVDWHILSDSNPTIHQDEAARFFDEMSRELASYDNVLYEICNEPNGGTDWATIKKYAEKIIPIIRANAKDAIVIVGTPTWSQDVDQAVKNPIRDYDNVMYALHFYADTHRDNLRSKLENAIKAGLPVFVTEFGTCDASGGGAINESEANKWMDLLVKYNVSSCIWNISNKDETCALLKSSCKKTSKWTMDDLSAQGKWFVNWMMKNAGAVGSGEGGTLDLTVDEGEESSSTPGDSSLSVSSSGSVVATADIVNSWESEGTSFYQCDIHITNNGDNKLSGWTIRLDLGGPVNISQNWCCKCKVSGTAIVLSPESYNGEIASGETRGDIGIIFSLQGDISNMKIEATGK